MLNQLMLDVLRQVNNSTTGAGYDPNMPIPRPGQPTNYQIPVPNNIQVGGNTLVPSAQNYINQDIAGFNARPPIPGLTGEGSPPQHLPQMPMSQFRAAGPYGDQAMRMAGLLSQPNQPAPSGGLLGGPRRGLRIPGGK